MKKIILLCTLTLSLLVYSSSAIAGWGDGYKKGTEMGESWMKTYNQGRANLIALRNYRASLREGYIDFIDQNSTEILSNRVLSLNATIVSNHNSE